MSHALLQEATHLATMAVQYDAQSDDGADPMMARLAETYYDKTIEKCIALLCALPPRTPAQKANLLRARLLHYVQRRRILLRALKRQGFPCPANLFNNVSSGRSRRVQRILRSHALCTPARVAEKSEKRAQLHQSHALTGAGAQAEANAQTQQVSTGVDDEKTVATTTPAIATATLAAAQKGVLAAAREDGDDDGEHARRARRIASEICNAVPYESRRFVQYLLDGANGRPADAAALFAPAESVVAQVPTPRGDMDMGAPTAAETGVAAGVEVGTGIVATPTGSGTESGAGSATGTGSGGDACAVTGLGKAVGAGTDADVRKRKRGGDEIELLVGEISPIRSSVDGARRVVSPRAEPRREAGRGRVW